MVAPTGNGTVSGPLRTGRIETVLIFTHDFERMLSFYRDTLGLVVGFSSKEFAELSAGPGAGIALHRGGAEGITPDGDVLIEFLVQDIEATVRDLAARGVTTDPVRSEPFGRITAFKDPEGHRIGLEEPRRRPA